MPEYVCMYTQYSNWYTWLWFTMDVFDLVMVHHGCICESGIFEIHILERGDSSSMYW